MDYAGYKEKAGDYERKYQRYNRCKNGILSAYFKTYHRLQVIGRNNIPDGPAIIAANHSGGLDLDLLALTYFSIPGRTVTPLIVDHWHYLNSLWGRLVIGSGIPVWTDGRGLEFKYTDRYLAESCDRYPGLLLIFPEGNIQPFGRRHLLGTFYPGVARLAVKYRVPVVPAAVINFSKASPVLKIIKKHGAPDEVICLPFAFPFKLLVEFGKPLYLDQYYDKGAPGKEEAFRIANTIIRPALQQLLLK